MTYSAKIKAFRESRKLTHQQFANAVGVSRGSVQQWESGATAPKRVNQPAVAKFMGVTVADLMADESTQSGVISPDNKPNKPPAGVSIAQDAINLVNNPEYPAIRRVSLKAQAGVSGYAVEYLNDDGPPIVFGSRWYKSNRYHPEKMIALRVAGESMRPKYSDGDLVVINTDNKTPKDGLIYLVSYEGEVTLKRMIREAGEWWLSSDNPDKRRYPRKACNEHCEVIGKVVYHQTDNVDD